MLCTGRMEFGASVDIKAERELLDEQLSQWQDFYNQERTHSAIHCKTPQARFLELLDVLPAFQDIQAAYVAPQKKYLTNNHYYWAMPENVSSDNILCNPYITSMPC